ncbi:MAG: hypothetical protein N3E46_07115 [Gemmataceae bacterium]|nr:hypothetical protein [Gemmataceae bacterium]
MRLAVATVVLLGVSFSAFAHFVFVYVSSEAGEARLVFGHAAAPDPKTPATRAEKTLLTLRSVNGQDYKLVVEKGAGNYYRALLKEHQPRLIFGVTEAAVTQRGDNPPMLTWYYPKVIVGDPFAAGNTVGEALPMEIVPLRADGGVRFQVLRQGKTVADAEVSVDLSEKAEKGEVSSTSVKTDTQGLTPIYKEGGRYCVAARVTERRSGEWAGKKYEAVRHIATLVCDVPPLNGR